MEPDERARLAGAYRRTRYRLEIDGVAIALRVGAPYPLLDAALGAAGAATWAFITAFNPGSQPQSAAANRARDIALAREIDARSLRRWRCDGVDDDGAWPTERGWVISGIGRGAAIALGQTFSQNAILFGTRGGTAELVFCR